MEEGDAEGCKRKGCVKESERGMEEEEREKEERRRWGKEENGCGPAFAYSEMNSFPDKSLIC